MTIPLSCTLSPLPPPQKQNAIRGVQALGTASAEDVFTWVTANTSADVKKGPLAAALTRCVRKGFLTSGAMTDGIVVFALPAKVRVGGLVRTKC